MGSADIHADGAPFRGVRALAECPQSAAALRPVALQADLLGARALGLRRIICEPAARPC